MFWDKKRLLGGGVNEFSSLDNKSLSSSHAYCGMASVEIESAMKMTKMTMVILCRILPTVPCGMESF